MRICLNIMLYDCPISSGWHHILGPSPKITYSISWFPEQVGQSFSVITGTDGVGEKGLTINYADGTTISYYQQSTPVDYAGQIKSMEDLSSKSSVKPSALPHLVTVNGHQGMLWPPHMNLGDSKPGPIQVYWSDGKFNYIVTYPVQTSTDAQAVSIAASVY